MPMQVQVIHDMMQELEEPNMCKGTYTFAKVSAIFLSLNQSAKVRKVILWTRNLSKPIR